MTDYTASIEATLEKAAANGDREILNNVENALENGQDDFIAGEIVEESEEAQALAYAYGYLSSIDRDDLYVETVK